jgi:uncharacterized membrane protein YkgB
MSLSDEERRVLEEMERHLRAGTNDVVDITPRRRVNATVVTIGILVTVAGVGILLGGVVTQFTLLGLLGFVTMVVGVLLATSRKGAAQESKGSRRPAGSKPSAPSTFEQRWERRMGGDL